MNNYVLTGILLTIKGIKAKLITLLSSGSGWLLITLAGILNFFLPIREMFHILFLFIGIDAVFGILASKRANKPFTSNKARSTFYKLLVYALVICLAFLAEYVFAFTLTTKILFGIAYAVELYSIIANLLILRPDMPFLRLLSGVMISEIVNKTQLDEDEVKEILENENGNK